MHMGTVNVDQDAKVHETNDFVMASMNTATHAIQSINGMSRVLMIVNECEC